MGKLNHIAIATNDASGQVKFYRDILRRPTSERMPQPEHGVFTTFVDFGNTKVELLEPMGANSPISNFVEKNPKGAIHHICYEVDDLEAVVKHLKSKGITPLSPPKIGAHGNPVVFLHPKDCHGVLTELEQVPKAGVK